MEDLIPVTIITGFLGAGKTTLLNRILTDEHGQKIAVIENEFGEESIDNDLLVQSEDEEIITMNNGCICCTIRGDLAENLIRLMERKKEGKANFDRVIIETTGLADPGPVAQTFFMDEEVVSIDSSADALQMAQENAKRNGFDDGSMKWIEANVFEALREFRDKGEQFDLVILDPPKFASSHHHVDKAARAYKDINLNGLRILAPGGQLLTFSCSGAIDVDLFQKIVAGAVIDSRVEAWMMERLGAGIDHPLLMTHPEGEYLKGLHLLSRGTV